MQPVIECGVTTTCIFPTSTYPIGGSAALKSKYGIRLGTSRPMLYFFVDSIKSGESVNGAACGTQPSLSDVPRLTKCASPHYLHQCNNSSDNHNGNDDQKEDALLVALEVVESFGQHGPHVLQKLRQKQPKASLGGRKPRGRHESFAPQRACCDGHA